MKGNGFIYHSVIGESKENYRHASLRLREYIVYESKQGSFPLFLSSSTFSHKTSKSLSRVQDLLQTRQVIQPISLFAVTQRNQIFDFWRAQK